MLSEWFHKNLTGDQNSIDKLTGTHRTRRNIKKMQQFNGAIVDP